VLLWAVGSPIDCSSEGLLELRGGCDGAKVGGAGERELSSGDGVEEGGDDLEKASGDPGKVHDVCSAESLRVVVLEDVENLPGRWLAHQLSCEPYDRPGNVRRPTFLLCDIGGEDPRAAKLMKRAIFSTPLGIIPSKVQGRTQSAS
jgi:hypothetical protein